jgi:hypothetical protein
MHEDAAHDVGDEDAGTVAGIEQSGTAAGRPLRIVGRTQELVMAAGKSDGFLLVPDVIARRHHVGTGIDRFEEDVLGYAEAAGGVFAVDDHEVEFQVRYQTGEAIPDRRTSGLADHVTQKKQSHCYPIQEAKKRRPLSVRMASRLTSCGSSGTCATSWQSNAMPISFGCMPFCFNRSIARS